MAKQPIDPQEIRQELSPEAIRKRMSFYVHEVGDGQKTARSLTLDEIEDAARIIFDGRASEAQAATFLVALRIKGSSDDERYGLLNVLREYNDPAGFAYDDLVDYSGFFDGRDAELHLSPAIALVAVAAGARVVLAGGDSRNFNTAHRVILQEVLAALGIPTERSLDDLKKDLGDLGLGFINAHRVNRALHNPVLARIRAEVGLRTPINTVEVSLNPANAPYQIRGMFHPGSREQMARIMTRSGFRRGLLLSGIGGSGEAGTFKNIEGFEIVEREIRPFRLQLSDLGIPQGKRSDLRSPDPRDQARRILAVLEGKAEGIVKDMTLLNAGLILYICGKVDSVAGGREKADAALAGRKPMELLESWRRL